MKTRVYSPEEINWKVIEMKKDAYSNCTIMGKPGIKNVSQIKTWMKKNLGNRWFRWFDKCPFFGVTSLLRVFLTPS
ncbi:hypothetical protein [Bacillus wiedmannii]|uniref:hypothetical protein n=1 Tax=Bacillus wiedmannii TaxID=1890302 RepID=UPI00352A0E8F